MGFISAPEEIWAILLCHPLGHSSFHPHSWLLAPAQPIFSTGDLMERCSSSTTSANPRVKKTSPTNTHYCLLTNITSGFALCLQAVSRWPCGTALDGCWMVMLEAGSRAAPRCGVCQPLSPAGTHGLTALGPQCLPAREAETGQLHPGLLFSLSFCLLFGELVALHIALNALALS